ncbi:hypothetical protein L9F63_016729, partial [Diploptera punctata]
LHNNKMNSTLRSVRLVLRVVSVRSLATQPDKHIVRSPYRDVTVPDVNLVQFVWKMVDKFPSYTALMCGVTGRSYTYAESRSVASTFASSLRKAGYRKASTLAMVLYNCPEFPLVMLGAIEAGMVVTTINPTYTEEEMGWQIIHSGASCVVTTPESLPNVLKAVRGVEKVKQEKVMVIVTPGLSSATTTEGAVKFQDMVSREADTSSLLSSEAASPGDVAVMPFSSGTTGLPKGVQLSHKNLIANCLQMCDTPVLWIVDPATSEKQDVVMGVLPFFHVYGLSCILLSSMYFGAKIITLPKFEPNLFLSSIIKHKATVLYLVPPLVQFLGKYPEVTSEHFKTVRFVTSGAGPIGEADAKLVLNKGSHIHFIQGYGLTETSPLVSILHKKSTNLNSSGSPIPNTLVKIINTETGTLLGPGQVGELCVHGPQVMLGYHNNPSATAETIDSEGWLHTGDLGYYNETSNLFIVDRLKELIKVKGYQVAPAELEKLLRQHPKIDDVAVIGIPNERLGEAPCAFIVSRSKLTEDEVKNFVKGKVAEYKELSGGVQFIQEIPKNPAGKILRRTLRDMYCVSL